MVSAGKLVDEVVSEVAGEDVLPLVKAMKDRKNISEFKLAEKIKKEINLTRNMLYRLYGVNLVSFIRKKDKKKGWYIYYWTFNKKRVKDLLKSIKKKKLDRLTERLSREEGGRFYVCSQSCIRLDFDQSTEFEYKCPECGELLNHEDNAKKITEITKQMARLEKDLKR